MKTKEPKKNIKRRSTAGFGNVDINNLDLLGDIGEEIEDEGNDIYDKFEDSTPLWAREGTRRDAEKRLESDPKFDPSTLYIPDSAWKQLTMAMKQFWQIKSQNFDKVIFFKLGKFYETFYDDAMLTNRVLGLKFMGKKMHAGFPESSIERYATQLVNLGYKVGVVDQVESQINLKDRLTSNKEKKKKSEKVIKRELTQVLTKGTIAIKPEESSITLRYFWSFTAEDEGVFSVIITEISLGITYFFNF